MSKLASAKVKGLKKLNDSIRRAFDDSVFSKSFLEEQAKFLVERIRATVRGGSSHSGGKKKKLKRLSDSYMAMREGAVKFRTIGGPGGRVVPFPGPDERLKEVDKQFFEPRTSNLTFTGQMLKAITSVVKKRVIDIFVDDSSRSGKYEKLTNKQVSEYVAEQGRPFLAVDKQGRERVRREALKSLRKRLRSRR